MQRILFSTKPFLVLLLMVALVSSACASRGGKTYRDGEVRTAQSVSYGTVAHVGHVMVEDDPSGAGLVLGGVGGGVLGSLLGGGRGRVLTAIGGAAAGALAGSLIEGEVRNYKALEITIDLDKGGTVVIVQGKDELFVKGDKVRIVSGGSGSARVQHVS